MVKERDEELQHRRKRYPEQIRNLHIGDGARVRIDGRHRPDKCAENE